jgi:hypothetical protein
MLFNSVGSRFPNIGIEYYHANDAQCKLNITSNGYWEGGGLYYSVLFIVVLASACMLL